MDSERVEVEVAEKPVRGRKMPRANLETCVGNLERIHEQIGSGPFDRKSIAVSLGYSNENGTSNAKIGALTHFGLLDRTGSSYRVSELGAGILTPTDGEERRICIVKAALQPSVYHELYAEYVDQPVPKLLANLMHRRFGMSLRAAESGAELFCESMSYAGLLKNGVLNAEPHDPPDEHEEARKRDTASSHTDRVVESRAAGSNIAAYHIPLSGNRVGQLELPPGLCTTDITRIKGWLDLMSDVLTADNAKECGTEEVDPQPHL